MRGTRERGESANDAGEQAERSSLMPGCVARPSLPSSSRENASTLAKASAV